MYYQAQYRKRQNHLLLVFTLHGVSSILSCLLFNDYSLFVANKRLGSIKQT